MKARPRLSSQGRSDEELLAKLRRADLEAFHTLYEAYFPRIYSYFERRLETLAEIERATEAVFTAVVSGISEGRSQLPLERWIFSKVRGAEVRGVTPPPLLEGSASVEPRAAAPLHAKGAPPETRISRVR